MGTKGNNACNAYNVQSVQQSNFIKYKLLLSLFSVAPEGELEFMGEYQKQENSQSIQRKNFLVIIAL